MIGERRGFGDRPAARALMMSCAVQFSDESNFSTARIEQHQSIVPREWFAYRSFCTRNEAVGEMEGADKGRFMRHAVGVFRDFMRRIAASDASLLCSDNFGWKA